MIVNNVMIDFRPFRLTCVIARACISTRANLSARAIVTRVKSHIQPKRSCSIEYSSFNPLFIFTSAIFE